MSSTPLFGLDHIQAEQLGYVHCNFCNTILAVSVPCSSMFKIVTVRCGHCTNLLSVNMRALLQPPPTPTPPANHHFFTTNSHNLLNENQGSSAIFLDPGIMKESGASSVNRVPNHTNMSTSKNTTVNRPPEKRQRVPSAYNRFIKDEIQRIKAGNPDITHREAFSAAAKNWAHFPHIHFGLMGDQNIKKANLRQQEGDDLILLEGLLTAANMGVSPY